MNKYILLFSIAIAISIGCYKNEDNSSDPEIIVEIVDVFINTSISGKAIDVNGNLMKDYNIQINNQTNAIESDNFFLDLENVKKKGQTIHLKKDGNQVGISTVLLVENDINYVKLQRHNSFIENEMTIQNANVEVGKDISADLSIAEWEGNYEGKIFTKYVAIDFKTSLTTIGFTKHSDAVAVDSRGGFYLQAHTESGLALKAKEEKPIILKTNGISNEINSLFVFDEINEIWVLVADISKGDEVEIKGEGYYTFAKYSKGIFVEGRVLIEGIPVAFQPMTWNFVDQSNEFYSTEKGRWIAFMPQLESVLVNLHTPCGDILFSEDIPIESIDISDQDLIVAKNANYQYLDLIVYDCEGKKVNEPILSIGNNEGTDLYHFSESQPNKWIAVCDNYDLAAYNQTSSSAGPKIPWSTNIDGEVLKLINCEEYALGYSYIKIRNDEKIFPAFEIELGQGRTILRSTNNEVKFIFKGVTAGMYEMNQVNVLINDSNFIGEKGYFINCENSELGCGISKFNVTHFPTENDGWMRVEFSGEMWMQTLNPSLAGHFAVEGVILTRL